MPTMYILRGLPASGKSTWRKESKLPYVNKDEIRKTFPQLSERNVHALMLENLRTLCNDQKDVVIDNTNFNTSAVNQYKSIAQEFGYDVRIKIFDAPVRECMYRDNLRKFNGESYVGSSVIWRMAVDAGLTNDPIFGIIREAVIFDVDGTLADTSHRVHFVTNGKKDWDGFFGAQDQDPVHHDISRLVDIFKFVGYTVLIVSGRPETYRRVTENWLTKKGISYEFLFMRGFNNKQDDDIVKKDIYNKYIKDYFKVHYVLDDRNRVVKAWRDMGLRCLQVAEGDF